MERQMLPAIKGDTRFFRANNFVQSTLPVRKRSITSFHTTSIKNLFSA